MPGYLSRSIIGLICFPLAVASVCHFADAAGSGTPTIVLAPAQTPLGGFEVRGLRPDLLAELRKLSPDDPRWRQIFRVQVVSAKTSDPAKPGDQPAMLGTYETTREAVRFRPRFPLERGLEYRANFDWPTGPSPNHVRLSATFLIPASPGGPPARVVAIYPSGPDLPENLLRLYIQFSAPMSQGNCYGRVHLRDETTGTKVQRPFLELPQELWSPDGTRLTLLLEPGRVKHDLVPRKELGPILVAGRAYSLTLDSSWRDAEGRPLAAGMHKTYRAVKADAAQLDPRAWIIERPAAKTRSPLCVRFPKPLDRGMLERVLHVQTSQGAEIPGAVQITNNETRWAFEPRQPWSAGRYVLAVSTRLEDPSGNSIGRPFEVDLKRSPATAPTPEVLRLEFDVREQR